MDVLNLVKKRRRQCLEGDSRHDLAVEFYDSLLEVSAASCYCDCLSTDEGLSHFLGVMYLHRLFEEKNEELEVLMENVRHVLTQEQVHEVVNVGSLVFSEKASAKSIKTALTSITESMRTILSSNYFTTFFNKTKDPVSSLLQDQLEQIKQMKQDDRLDELEKDLKNLKKKVTSLSTREESGKSAFEFGSLTNRQLKRFLHALRSRSNQGGLVKSLFTTKPPNLTNMLSHKQALETCVEHGRLWLLGSDLPIYGGSELKYNWLGIVNTRGLEEDLLTSESGYLAKSFSWTGKALRHEALDDIHFRGLKSRKYAETACLRRINLAIKPKCHRRGKESVRLRFSGHLVDRLPEDNRRAEIRVFQRSRKNNIFLVGSRFRWRWKPRTSS